MAEENKKEEQKQVFTTEQLAVLELQQHLLSLLIRLSALEKLLVGTTIDEESYKKEIEHISNTTASVINDKIKDLEISKEVKEKE